MADRAKAAASTRDASQALFALMHIGAQVVRPIDEELTRRHGIGLTGFEVLKRLADLHEDGASVRLLSDHVVLSSSRVSRVVDDLTSRGHLERAVSPQDGRLSLVRLTEHGRRQLADMEASLRAALDRDVVPRLSSQQLATLVSVGRALGAPHC